MIKNSAIYLVSSVMNKLSPFILLPILTRYLSPSEYGVIAIIQVFLSIFLSLYGSLNSNIPRKYFNLTKKQFSIYMSALVIVLFLLLLFSIFISLIYLYSGWPLFGLDISWYLAMPVIACMNMANLLNLTLLRTKEQPYRYAAWEVSHAVLNLLISLILVIYLGGGWEGRAVGIMAPLLIYGVIGLYAFSQHGIQWAYWNWSDIKETLRVSIPLIPHALSAVIIVLSDRLIIQKLLGDDAVGVYSVGYQVGMVVMLFTDAFLKAWQPWFYKKLNANTNMNKYLIVRFTRLYLVLLILGAVFYSLILKELFPFIVGEQYSTSAEIIFPVALSYVAFGAYQIFFPYLIHSKKTDILI